LSAAGAVKVLSRLDLAAEAVPDQIVGGRGGHKEYFGFAAGESGGGQARFPDLAAVQHQHVPRTEELRQVPEIAVQQRTVVPVDDQEAGRVARLGGPVGYQGLYFEGGELKQCFFCHNLSVFLFTPQLN
jgi:hypothetical protein